MVSVGVSSTLRVLMRSKREVPVIYTVPHGRTSFPLTVWRIQHTNNWRISKLVRPEVSTLEGISFTIDVFLQKGGFVKKHITSSTFNVYNHNDFLVILILMYFIPTFY